VTPIVVIGRKRQAEGSRESKGRQGKGSRGRGQREEGEKGQKVIIIQHLSALT
jgi:hypothetical protein